MKRHGPGVEASKLSRKKRTSSMPRSGVEPCLAAAQKAEAEAAKHRPTAEQKQARIAELEERARMFGDSVKQSAQAKVLEGKWVRLAVSAGPRRQVRVQRAQGSDRRAGQALHVVLLLYSGCGKRDRARGTGRLVRAADQVYAAEVCVRLAEVQGLGRTFCSEHALHDKAEPFKFAVREHWKRLKRSDPELKSTIKPFVKKKWCDTAYFLTKARVAGVVWGRGGCEAVANTV